MKMEMVGDHVILKLAPDVNPDRLSDSLPPGYRIRRRLLSGDRFLVSFDPVDAQSLPDALNDLEAFGETEPDGYVYAAMVPDDPEFGNQWALGGSTGISAPNAWDRQTGSSAITVALIDTGIDYGHPDLAANI